MGFRRKIKLCYLCRYLLQFLHGGIITLNRFLGGLGRLRNLSLNLSDLPARILRLGRSLSFQLLLLYRRFEVLGVGALCGRLLFFCGILFRHVLARGLPDGLLLRKQVFRRYHLLRLGLKSTLFKVSKQNLLVELVLGKTDLLEVFHDVFIVI